MSAGVFAELAPRYFEAGYNVLPVVPLRKKPPEGVTWKQWQHRRQTADEIAQLVDEHPTADVAVMLNGFVDIETDGQDGEQVLQGLGLPLPNTPIWEAPRGLHRLCRGPEHLPTRIGFRPHLDVLAGGGRYAIVPESTGRRWLSDRRLEDIADLPEAWVEVLLERNGKSARSVQRPHLHHAATGTHLVMLERRGAAEGVRNVSLASLVGHWLTRGHSEEDIIRRAVAWARKCTPAMPQEEAIAVVRHVITSRSRSRSSLDEAMAIARAYNLRHPERAVFLGLVALWNDLGMREPLLFASDRTAASWGGVSLDGSREAIGVLVKAGLIEESWGRDPWGRRTRIVQFLVPVAIRPRLNGLEHALKTPTNSKIGTARTSTRTSTKGLCTAGRAVTREDVSLGHRSGRDKARRKAYAGSDTSAQAQERPNGFGGSPKPSDGCAASRPNKPCHACGGARFWRSHHGLWVCWICHPPAVLSLVVEEAAVA